MSTMPSAQPELSRSHVRTAVQRILSPWVIGGQHRMVVVTVLSIVFGIVFLVSTVARLTPPQLSLVLMVPTSHEARIQWILPGGNLWEHGVRPGDQVLALDGEPPTVQAVGWWVGNSVLVRTSDGGTVLLDADMIRRNHVAWPLLVLGPWFLLPGTLVYLRAPQPNIGKDTYILFGNAAFALALAPAAVHSWPVAAAAEYALVTLFAASFLLFCMSFPRSRGSSRIRSLLLLPPFLVAVLGPMSLIWPVLHEPFALLRLGVLLIYLLAGISLIGHTVTIEQEADARHGIAIVSGGIIAAILPFLVLYVVPVLLERPPLLAAEFAILPLAILPASFAYAILRHNVLHVSLLQRWLVHGLLWLGLLVPYAMIIAMEEWLLARLPEPWRSLLFAAVLVILVGVSFGWLREHLQRTLDRLIFKDSYDYRASLHQLSQDLSIASDLETLSASLLGNLRRLVNLDFAVLLLQTERGPVMYKGVGAYQAAMTPEVVEAARRAQDVPQIVPLAYGYLNLLVVPLRTSDIVIGHLCFGPKASGEPFRMQDRDLLATISGQIAAVVQNARLVADLRTTVNALETLNEQVQHAQEEERARLAADLHDEPLQTALHLQRRLTAYAPQDSATAEQIALSQTLIDQLRTICSAMRPPVLDDLGLVAALDSLVQEHSARAGIPIRLDIDLDIVDTPLAPASEVVLYRAAQEALTNSLRHAQPRMIQVELRASQHSIHLIVVDDGSGFVVPERFDHLVIHGHLGLAGLHERLRHAGGRLDVQSTPGQGTLVQVALSMVEAS